MTDTAASSAFPPMFEHKKRKDWGVSMIAWERQNKRAYLFDDGELRILAEPFYGLMKEVDRPSDEAEALYQRLLAVVKAADPDKAGKSRSSSNARTMTFQEQINVLRAEYPGGLHGERWASDIRGEGEKKALKRHRDAALSSAQERLSSKVLEEMLSQHQYRGVWDEALGVMGATDLVPAAQLKNLKTDNPDHLRSLATTVRDMLHGDGAFEVRMDKFLSAYATAFQHHASWQLATVLPALVSPSEHVCIRPTSFKEQAKWMAPRLTGSKTPTAAEYARWLAMARLVSEKLEDRGESPRDLVDVHDFIRVTTSPSARKVLAQLSAPSDALTPTGDGGGAEGEAA